MKENENENENQNDREPEQERESEQTADHTQDPCANTIGGTYSSNALFLFISLCEIACVCGCFYFRLKMTSSVLPH